MQVYYTKINANEEGQRLDNYLMRILNRIPKSHIYRLIRKGEVRINKKRAKASSRLSEGDSIRIPPVSLPSSSEKPEKILIPERLNTCLRNSILFEDDNLIVINKPIGLAVHKGSGLEFGIIEALRETRKDLSYIELVHRLDKETSGCLLLAKNRPFLRELQKLLIHCEIHKVYWALLHFPWTGKQIQAVDQPLKKNQSKSNERIVTIDDEGKEARTVFTLLENFNNACWVLAAPQTGRTHQIRVHSAYLDHPIVGDSKYEKLSYFKNNLESKEQITDFKNRLKQIGIKPRLYLHARSIQFTLNKRQYRFEAELDDRFSDTLKKLRTGVS